MTHASSNRIAGMGKAVIRRIDAHMRRQMGIFEIWDDPRSQFRVSLETTSRPVNVPGLSLPAGARILDLHFWSEHALDQPTEGAATGVSLRQYKLIIASFKAIGNSLKTDPRLADVQAVHALTPLFFREERNTGPSMLSRLGFTVVPFHNPMGAFGQFWQDLHIWLLTWAIKPEVLGRRTRFKNVWNELWFSADAYVQKYGPKEKGRKP